MRTNESDSVPVQRRYDTDRKVEDESQRKALPKRCHALLVLEGPNGRNDSTPLFVSRLLFLFPRSSIPRVKEFLQQGNRN